MSVEPSESALRVLSTMFDAASEGDTDERLGPAYTISATRPAEDCGCQHVERKPMSRGQF
jgi:hypothetical protein